MTTPAAEAVRTAAFEYYGSRQLDIECGFTGYEDDPWPVEDIVQWLLMCADELEGVSRRWPVPDLVGLLLSYTDDSEGVEQPPPARVQPQLSQAEQQQGSLQAQAVRSAAAAFYTEHQVAAQFYAEVLGDDLLWDSCSVGVWLNGYAQGLEQ